MTTHSPTTAAEVSSASCADCSTIPTGQGIAPRKLTALSIEHSLCFRVFQADQQVGLAMVLTDRGATSYVCDVVPHADHRSPGVGSWVTERILEHPAVRRTRVLLITRDARDFYRKFGFTTHPYECMRRSNDPS